MTAEAIAKALDGRKGGAAWMARCPAHDDREPSLSISDGEDGKVLVHCHAGCEQADLIAALRSRGLWEDKGYRRDRITRRRRSAEGVPDGDSAKRVEAALAVHRARRSKPISSHAAFISLRRRHSAFMQG